MINANHVIRHQKTNQSAYTVPENVLQPLENESLNDHFEKKLTLQDEECVPVRSRVVQIPIGNGVRNLEDLKISSMMIEKLREEITEVSISSGFTLMLMR